MRRGVVQHRERRERQRHRKLRAQALGYPLEIGIHSLPIADLHLYVPEAFVRSFSFEWIARIQAAAKARTD